MAYTIEKGKKFIPADSACFQYVGELTTKTRRAR